MAYQEKSLQCVDCGKTFLFTVEEQEFFASKGYVNEPKRCLDCRARGHAWLRSRVRKVRLHARCILPFVPNAARKLGYPFSPGEIGRSTAGTAIISRRLKSKYLRLD